MRIPVIEKLYARDYSYTVVLCGHLHQNTKVFLIFEFDIEVVYEFASLQL